MNCLEFERRLQHLLDERAPSLHADDLPKRLRSHVAHCADCSELLDGYRALFAALSSERREPAARPATVPSLKPEAANLTPAWQPSWLLRATVPWATAASLLLAAFAVYQSNPPTTAERGPIGPSALNAPATALLTTSPLTASLPATSEIVSTARTPVARTVFGSPLEFDERSLGLVLNLAGLSPVALSAELLDLPLVERTGWMTQVSDGLKPVAERMTGTLNALLQGVPSTAAPQEEGQGARYDPSSHFGCLS